MAAVCKELHNKLRKRHASIVIPEACVVLDEVCKDSVDQREVVEVEGKEFFVASRRGRKKNMEDKYAVVTNIAGNSMQAFFGVFYDHGGQKAVDFIVDELGKNIVGAMKEAREEEDEDSLGTATKLGYKTTDDNFLAQGLKGGACTATVLIKDGEGQVAHVGDCRVVLSRNCVAHAVTNDHMVERHDERCRIQSLVTNHDAVDEVLKHGASSESCNVLAELSCMRGNKDDITVTVVDLGSFV